MKKAIAIMGGAILSLMTISTQAQTDTTKPAPVETVKPEMTTTDTPKRWDPKNNPAVSEINAKYKDKYVTSRTALSTEEIFPALGNYQSTTNPEAASVSITIDPENKGMVWIEGLPQGKVKAMLRKSPATYKIPVQKTEDEKEIPEGTAVFDKETNTLSIVIGKNYNAADPTSVFMAEPVEEVVMDSKEADLKEKEAKKMASVKKKDKVKKEEKAKPWIYTGTKIEKTVAVN
jgi:hypothetical protein